MRTASPLLQLLSKLLDILLLVEIGSNEVCLTPAERIQLLAGLLTRLCIARGNVDICTIGNKALRDHAADAFGASSDQHRLALGNVSKWAEIHIMRRDEPRCDVMRPRPL